MNEINRCTDDLLAEIAVLKNRVEELETYAEEHKMLTRVCRELQAHHKSLLQYAPIGYFLVDPDGMVEDVNGTWLALHGYSTQEEIVGRHFIETVVGLHIEETERLFQKALGGQPVANGQVGRYRKDGTVGYHIITMLPVRKNGVVTGVEGIITDTTVIREAEQEKRKLFFDLEYTLEQINTLSGILPICASCKNIRDDQGYWNQVEQYISERTLVNFTHTICPGCQRSLYPDLFDDVDDVNG